MDASSITDVFKNIQVPLMCVGPDGAILHCNSATYRLFGYDENDLVGRPVIEVLHLASSKELNAYIQPPATGAIIKDVIGRSRTGNPIPLVIQLTAWNDPERGLQYALVLRDVTEEMKAAHLANGELARANNAIKGARIGVFEYNPSADAVIVSDIWRDLVELDPLDTVDVQVEWRGRVHPDDLEAVLETIRVCQEGISERASCEYRLQSKDGSRWRWMRTDVAITRWDLDGKVIGISGAMTDITEGKITENALRRSVEQFRSTFNNATIGMATVDLDGSWLAVNPALCDLLGYLEADLLETNFQFLTHPDDLHDDLFKFNLLKAGNIPAYQIEKRYICANGAVMWGFLSVGMVRDAEGNPEHFIAQIVDVTEQRRLRDLRREFVTTVSHELRTPLTSVLGSLTLLSSMENEPFSDEAQRLLFIAETNGKRLHALVNDILDFEKFSANKMLFTLSHHHIGGLIREAVLANMVSADNYGVRFDIHCPDRSLKGFVEPNRFQQVMTNLLTNAAKFAEEGSIIDIVVESQAKFIRVSVVNEGDGIPVSFRDQVFMPFAQAAPSANRARGGTGLGLNITKQIVEQTGGTIGFESALGGRTTFWFTVPTKDPS